MVVPSFVVKRHMGKLQTTRVSLAISTRVVWHFNMERRLLLRDVFAFTPWSMNFRFCV